MALDSVTPPFTGVGEAGEGWGTHTRADGKHMQDVHIGIDGSNAGAPIDAIGMSTKHGLATQVFAAWNSATAVNTSLNLDVKGLASVTMSLVPAGPVFTAGDLIFEGSLDEGTTWFTVVAERFEITPKYETGIDLVINGAAPRLWTVDVSGLTDFRIRLSEVIAPATTAIANLRIGAVASPSGVRRVQLVDPAGNQVNLAQDHVQVNNPMAVRPTNGFGWTDFVDPLEQFHKGFKFTTRQTGTLLILGPNNAHTIVRKLQIGAMGTVAGEIQVYFGTMRATTATGVNAANSAILNVGATAAFPSVGTFVMSNVETAYTGKTGTSFTGCGNHPATTGGEAVRGGYDRAGGSDRAIFDHGFAPSASFPYPGVIDTGPWTSLAQNVDLLVATSADLVVIVNLWYETVQA